MRFLWYFRAASYLLVASGFFALLVTNSYGLVAGMVFALLLWGGWQVDSGAWRVPLTPLAWNLLTVAALLVSVADAWLFRRLQAVSMVNFLIFLQAAKMLAPKRNRDYVTLYLISLVLLLASTIMTYSILFAVACMLFAVAATWALMMLYLKVEIETQLPPPSDGQMAENPENRLRPEQNVFQRPAVNNLVNGRFFAGALVITLMTFCVALVIFVVMPRAREGVFFMYGAELSQQVSGFSEEVNLNTFGTIRRNYQPVMRVSLPDNVDPDALAKPLYWRGMAFDSYDGERWKAEPKHWKRIPVQSRFEKFYWLLHHKNLRALLPQTVELASLNFEVLFGADAMRAVEGTLLSLNYDRVSGNVHTVYDPQHLTYTVYSDLSYPTEAELRTASGNYPEEITASYLQVPRLADRVHELARELGEGQPTPYDAALSIQNYLQQNYAYSLDVERSGDVPLLEDFLFVNQAGHCEFYATGMAILLRLQGIPARVVNGFARGRWNEYGHFFTVRQSDAHSWVEAYFPGVGWAQFDPTPGAAFGETYQEFVEQESLAASLYRYSEYVRVRWNRYVVDYDRESQAQALLKAFLATRDAQRNLRRWVRQQRARVDAVKRQFSPQRLGRTVGFAAGGLLLVYGAYRLLRGRQFRFPWFRRLARNRRPASAVRFYQQMRRMLSRKGISLTASATPGEFARYVAHEHAAYAADVRAITEAYYRVRYGRAAISQEEERQILLTLRHLKTHHKT